MSQGDIETATIFTRAMRKIQSKFSGLVSDIGGKADQATTYTKLETVAEFNQYGLGAQSVNTEVDADLYLTAGTYISPNGGHINFPSGSNQRALITVGGGISYFKQEVQQQVAPFRRFFRSDKTSSIGSSQWQEIYHTGITPNFTDMPQVGGDPIVESGSNADGEWTRWADGTQICIIESALSGTAGVRYEIYYPASFSDATSNFRVAAGSEDQGSSFTRQYNVNSVSTQSTTVFNAYLESSPIVYPIRYSVTGRWK
jgi:hypothetical protein